MKETKKTFSDRDLVLITFILGFFSANIQVLLVRELLAIFRGNEFIIGIIYSAWFFGIYLGARNNPEAVSERLEKRIKLSLLILPVMLVLSVYFSHLFQVIVPKTIGSFYSISTEFILSMVFYGACQFLNRFFFSPGCNPNLS